MDKQIIEQILGRKSFVLMKTNKTTWIVGIGLDKEYCEYLTNCVVADIEVEGYNFSKDNIIAVGNTREIDGFTASNMVEKLPNGKYKNYNELVIHDCENSLSSFKSAMFSITNPLYAVIIQIRKPK